MIEITAETDGDAAEIEALYDTCFAPGRAALSSYRLREGVAPVADLCRVARDSDAPFALAGAIRFWPVMIGESGAPALLLGPLATHPTRQGEGVGAALMFDALDRAAALGWARVILIGDEPYYRRFGFNREAARALSFPRPYNPDRLLAKPLVTDAFAGLTGDVRKYELTGARG